MMHLDLQLFRAHDGRVEGRIRSDEGSVVPFCGTLELLRAIEDLDPEPPLATPSSSAPARRWFRKAFAWILLVALLCGALVAWVVLDDDGAPATRQLTLRGFAYADEPLQNATFSIHTADGDEVARSRAATGAGGTFAVPAELPPGFRVTVSGGTLGEQVFTGRLVADVVGYGPSSGLIDVNPITTLLAAYQDRHEDLSSAEAKAAVARFLKLPGGVDVAADLRGNEQWFNAKDFLSQANTAGGVQPFVAELVAEMDARPAKTHAFVGAAQNFDLGIDGAKKLVDVVAHEVLGTALSHLLEQIGLGEAVDAESIALLHEVQAQLTQLQASVDQAIQLLTQVSYDQWAIQIIPIKNAVRDTYRKLEYAAVSGDKGVADDVRRSIDGLADSHALSNLNSFLTGDAASTGGYKAWSNLIKSKNTFWGPVQSKQLFDYIDFYDTIQVELLHLLRERATSKTPPTSQEAFNATDGKQYDDQRAAQQATRASVKAAPTPVDIRTNFMWPIGNGNRPDVAWAAVPEVLEALNTGTTCAPMLGTTDPCVAPGKLYGFGDWRVPSNAELTAVTKPFVYRTGEITFRDWLREQWGADAFNRCPGGSGGQCWPIEYLHTSTTAKPSYESCIAHFLFDTYRAGLSNINCDGKGTVAVWPVRTVAPTEKYWL